MVDPIANGRRRERILDFEGGTGLGLFKEHGVGAEETEGSERVKKDCVDQEGKMKEVVGFQGQVLKELFHQHPQPWVVILHGHTGYHDPPCKVSIPSSHLGHLALEPGRSISDLLNSYTKDTPKRLAGIGRVLGWITKNRKLTALL